MRLLGWLLVCSLAASACTSSPISRKLGAQCTDKDDCDERCLRGAEYPDGLCSIACNGDDDCPSDARCVDIEGGVCLFRCGEPQDCAELLGVGWECQGVDPLIGEDEVQVCIGD